MNTTIVARSQEADRYILYAKLDSAKVLYNLTKAVNFKDVSMWPRIFLFRFCSFVNAFLLMELFGFVRMKHAVFCALENGLKVSCEDAKCTQGIAFVHSNLFQEYSVKEECVCIKINLSVSTSGVATALKICYEGYGHPLILL